MAKRSRGKISTELSNFTIFHNEFIDSKLLSGYEKLVFMAIKRHLNSESSQAFPSIKTICSHTGLSKPTVIKAIKSLEDKEILAVEHRESEERGHMSNLYTLMDYKEMWKAPSAKDMKAVAKSKQYEWAKQIIEAAGGRVVGIEKESEYMEPTKVTINSDPSINQFTRNNNTQKDEKSQPQERYSLEDIQELFEYSVMLNDFPELRADVDNVITILYETLNTTKKTVRIASEDIPAMVVIGKLMKLTRDEILYSIRMFNGSVSEIKNHRAYMLTILYRAKEQYAMDIQNQITRAEAAAENPKEEY